MVGGFGLNTFRKGDKLTKQYLFNKMKGNPEYAAYVPDNIDPTKLSREFLLAVNIILIFVQLIAYVDPTLYKELYAISKIQLSQQKYKKWNDFKVEINENLIENIHNYSSVDK